MNNAQTLLFDILKIRSQYEDRDFEIVLDVLRNRQQDPQLVSVLEMALQVSEVSAKTSGKPSRQKKEATLDVEEVLSGTESDPEKHSMLKQIHEIVSGTKPFKTKDDLRLFIIRRVTHVKKSDTRPSMIQQYLTCLAVLSVQELEFELGILKNPKPKQSNEAEASSFLRMANRMTDPQR